MRPDRIAILDWSAESRPKTGRDSIWLGIAGPDGAVEAENLRTRAEAEAHLHALAAKALERGECLLIGADFAFGYPAGFAAGLTGRAMALAVWEWLAARIEDGPDNTNNRFEVAAEANRAFPGLGPFWFRPAGRDLPDLPAKGTARTFRDLPDLRAVDARARGAQSVWKLGGAGSVGSQSLTGLPVLWRLRQAFAGRVAVWPFETTEAAPVILAEVFPSLLRAEIATLLRRVENGRDGRTGPVPDEVQVRLLAGALAELGREGGLAPLFAAAGGAAPEEEGWVLGVGAEATLRAAARAVEATALAP